MGAKDTTKKKGMGLEELGDLSNLLSPAAASAPVANGLPIELEMDLIDEDPHQPRREDNPGFSAQSIAELGATIKARGVKSPISVRDNPDAPGRYLINHGARRYRASRWAEKTTIPGFIDNNYIEADQVIENLQRNELTPREIADYIGRELAKGKKKGEIAKDIGKSASFVTQHVNLLDLPEALANVFNNGRVRDVTVINELLTAYKKSPDEVAAWLEDDTQEITRGTVKLLREFLESTEDSGEGQHQGGTDAGDDGADLRDPLGSMDEGGGSASNAGDFSGDDDGDRGADEEADQERGERASSDPEKFKKAIVVVECDGRVGRILLDRRPSSAGLAWLKNDDDGHEFEAVLSDVKLVQLVEG